MGLAPMQQGRIPKAQRGSQGRPTGKETDETISGMERQNAT